jgi:hypothetical protein
MKIEVLKCQSTARCNLCCYFWTVSGFLLSETRCVMLNLVVQVLALCCWNFMFNVYPVLELGQHSLSVISEMCCCVFSVVRILGLTERKTWVRIIAGTGWVGVSGDWVMGWDQPDPCLEQIHVWIHSQQNEQGLKVFQTMVFLKTMVFP